jgi:hypothetical protein
MYGLYYPSVLGAGIIVVLQHAAEHSAAIFVALTAMAFFSLSFASAMGREEDYGVGAFIMDVIEVLAMFACFAYLKLVEGPAWLPPSVRCAYIVLICLVFLQLVWRKLMHFTTLGYLDLKIALVLCLAFGTYLGDSGEYIHGIITAAFVILAGLYVANHPYGDDVPMWFFFRKVGSRST